MYKVFCQAFLQKSRVPLETNNYVQTSFSLISSNQISYGLVRGGEERVDFGHVGSGFFSHESAVNHANAGGGLGAGVDEGGGGGVVDNVNYF